MFKYLRRRLYNSLTPNGRLVRNRLEQGGWTLTDFCLKHDSGLILDIGFGFWRFDINDGDYIRELSFVDKFVLWPVVMEMRRKLKWGSDEQNNSDA